MNLLSAIPLPWRILALAALAAAMLGFGWVKGAGHVQDQWDLMVAKQTLQVAVVKQHQAEATVKVVTEYVDRIKIVREKSVEIIKEIPIYVPTEADAACAINVGFVRLHDAAAANELPGAAGGYDAAPSEIALSTVAGTVADNYQRCHENALQLTTLQDWVRKQQTVTQ
jgi:hypothetical protein